MSVATRRIDGTPGVAKRIGALDWQRIAADLDAHGCAIVPAMLAPGECKSIENLYAVEKSFRSRIVMARHGYGRGEYKVTHKIALVMTKAKKEKASRKGHLGEALLRSFAQ